MIPHEVIGLDYEVDESKPYFCVHDPFTYPFGMYYIVPKITNSTIYYGGYMCGM